jgi:hypothetical protein
MAKVSGAGAPGQEEDFPVLLELAPDPQGVEAIAKNSIAHPVIISRSFQVSFIQDQSMAYDSITVFTDGDDSRISENDFLLSIPKNISSRQELFEAFEKRGDFPGYFGLNQDAQLDCLRDLSWIPRRRVVIRHYGLPLAESEARPFIPGISRDALAEIVFIR